MLGRIVKIISNLYTVETNENNEIKKYECRARGKFRNIGLTPLVGDIVEFDDQSEYILDIKDRRNELSRPMVANVDYAIVVTSCKRPDFSSFLLDKMLTNIYLGNINPIIVLTKYDLLTDDEKEHFKNIINYYKKIGIPTFINTEIEKLKEFIVGKIIVLTGQTGAGKSSLLNRIDDSLNLKTDDISEALGRGKHTTRHAEIFPIYVDTKKDYFYMVDTPGFSALDVTGDKDNIRFAFPEFKNDECKFNDCKHIKESGCMIKEEVEKGIILNSRYENYLKILEELR